MTLYARPDPNNPGQNDVRDSDTVLPLAKGWRPLAINVQPVPSATQAVANAGIVYTQTTATQTYALRNKPQAELDFEAQASELAALKAMVAGLNTDITNGITAAPTTAAQAFVDIQDIKRQVLRLNRAVRWMLKQQQ